MWIKINPHDYPVHWPLREKEKTTTGRPSSTMNRQSLFHMTKESKEQRNRSARRDLTPRKT